MSHEELQLVFRHERMPLVTWNAMGRPRKGKPELPYLVSYSRNNKRFIPAPVGGHTTVEMRYRDNSRWGLRDAPTGTSLCSFSDNFSYREGRRVALQRMVEATRDTIERLDAEYNQGHCAKERPHLIKQLELAQNALDELNGSKEVVGI